MYFTPADWLADYRQLRINRLAINDTWRGHSDIVSIRATLEPQTAQLKGETVPQKLTVNDIVKTLPIFKETRRFNTVTFSNSSADGPRNIFTTRYVTYFLVTKYLHQLIHHILPHFVTSYVRTALNVKTAISEGRHAVHSHRSVLTFRGNLPAPCLRQKTEL